MKISKEKQFLKIIKFTPSVFVVIITFFVMMFFYFENKKTFNEEKKEIEQNYILENKEIIKEEIQRVYDFLVHLQATTESELKKNVKSRVYEAHAIATKIYEKNKTTKTNDEILELIKNALSDIRFNDGRGYFFMDDSKGNKIFHPIDTSIEGKNFLNFSDAKGYRFFETIVKTINEKSERFDEYYWYKPNTNKEIGKKISFYKYFEPLNIAIGTGEYIDEFEKEIQKKALEYVNLIRFGKMGYIFIIDYNGKYLSHIKNHYVGKHYLENDGTKNVGKVIEDMIQIAKNGEGFYSYTQKNKPLSEISTNKVSYIKGLNNWNWIIGTGFYEDDVSLKVLEKKKKLDENYEDNIRNIFIISFVLIIVLLIISRYVSNYLENKFNEYKEELKKKQLILHQQSKMAAMGEMIANIAHQWRQPLSTITTASTGMVLQKQVGILSDEFFFDASKKINISAQYLSKTIDDFRNFFSPNKQKSKFFIKDLFNTTFDLISAQFSTKNIIIIENIEDIELFTYENELIQALINILNNSKDELIKIDSKDKFIFIDVFSTSDNKIVISIKDNAGGIKEENINKIFEPYFTTKHKSQGTGIGLYMTEEIITKHLKGEIIVENKEYLYNNESYIGAEFKIVINKIKEI